MPGHRRIAPRAFAAALAALTQGARAQTPPAPLVITPASADHALSARVGDTILVELPAQLGTGFSWTPVQLPPNVVLVGQHVQGRSSAPGGEETQVFTLRADAPGPLSLAFQYRQPWRPDAVAKTFEVSLKISD